jgi:hypothetical protein
MDIGGLSRTNADARHCVQIGMPIPFKRILARSVIVLSFTGAASIGGGAAFLIDLGYLEGAQRRCFMISVRRQDILTSVIAGFTAGTLDIGAAGLIYGAGPRLILPAIAESKTRTKRGSHCFWCNCSSTFCAMSRCIIVGAPCASD